MKRYFQQILYQFRTQPLMMLITVVGTALSIAFVMLYIMMDRVYEVPFAPESNRDRMLHIRWVRTGEKDANYSNTAGLCESLVRKCLYPVKSTEAVSMFAYPEISLVSLKGKGAKKVEMKATDAAFWKVFDFTFLSGKPYTEEDVKSSLPQVVINEDVAQFLFGSTDVVGQSFDMNYKTVRVCGVVRAVSTITNYAYSQVWAPYTYAGYNKSWDNYWEIRGPMRAVLLAKDRTDFPAIRSEVTKRMEKYCEEVSQGKGFIDLGNQPLDTREMKIMGVFGDMDMTPVWIRKALIIGLLVLIPAVNLSAMLHSRLRMRIMEVGVRRAFGATRTHVIGEMVLESLLTSIIGGVLGLILCFLFSYACSEWLFFDMYDNYYIRTGMVYDIMILFQWSTFILALLACVLLNLLSSSIPVWRAARRNIVNALKGGER